jgi:hypothetical protein
MMLQRVYSACLSSECFRVLAYLTIPVAALDSLLSTSARNLPEPGEYIVAAVCLAQHQVWLS